MKQILIGNEARKKLMAGISAITNAVKVTIGPKGRNVIIDRGYEPIIANDAGTVAKEIILKDKTENMGAQIIKSVIQKTSEKVGGGRTASAILTHALIEEGLKQMDKGMNMNLIKKGMQNALKDITANLKKISRPCTTKKELNQVATISTESEELGEVIAEVVYKVGKDGIVTVEDSQSTGTTVKFTEGLEFDKGYISPYMVTNTERMEAELYDVAVLITDKKISSFKEILPPIEKLAKEGKRELVIICEDMEGEALGQAVVNKLKGNFNILAIKAPGFGDMKKYCLEDLCAITGAETQDFKIGSAKKIITTKDTTKIIDGGGDVKAHVKKLQAQKENTESKMFKEQLVERIAKLSNSVAIIKVGANSETELKYLKLKIEDGVNEAKRALEEGIVPGGDVSFVNVAKRLMPKFGTDEESIGYNIVLKAIESPLKQIVENANGESQVVLNAIKTSESQTIGYDVLKSVIINNMFEAGIVDAMKVSRTVLENAVSAASMFLSCEVAISEEPEDEKLSKRVEY